MVDDEQFRAEWERLFDIAEQNGICTHWSLDNITSAQMADAHPFPDATTIVYETVAYFGGNGGRFESPLAGRTYLDLWRTADAVIRASGDTHHIFIEGFRPDGDKLVLLVGS